MMAIINNSYANVVSSFFGAKFHGNIQEMIIFSLPSNIVLLGFLSGGVARGFWWHHRYHCLHVLLLTAYL